MEMIQHVLICGGCGSVQSADVPIKLCACGSDHARDAILQLQVSQLCPRCSRLHAIDLDVDSVQYPERQCPECVAELHARCRRSAEFGRELEWLVDLANRLGLRVDIARNGFIGLVDPPSQDLSTDPFRAATRASAAPGSRPTRGEPLGSW